MYNQNINYILKYLILFFPLSLVSGPLIPEIILALSSIYVNFKILKNKQYYYYKSKVVLFFLIFWFYIILNSIFSENILWSLKSSIFYFRYLLFLISINYLLDKKIIKLSDILFFLVLTFAFLIIDLLIQYFSGTNILGYEGLDNRFSGLFGDELILGSYLSKFFPLIISLFFLKDKDYKIWVFLFIMCPIVLLTIILTGERTATFLTLIFIIFSSIIILKGKLHKLLYLISILIIFLLSINLNENLKNRFINDTVNYMFSKNYKNYINNNDVSIEDKNEIYIFSKLHNGHYKSAYKLFLEKPLFGNGPNSFRNLCQKFTHEYRCSTHPHNIILQFLSELGIIGFLFYLYLIFFLMKYFLKKENLLSLKILSLGLIVFIFPIAPFGNFFNNWISMNFYFILSICIYLLKNISNNYAE